MSRFGKPPLGRFLSRSRTTPGRLLIPPLVAALRWPVRAGRALDLVLRGRRDGVGPQDTALGYDAGLGVLLGVFTAVSLVELAVVHLLVGWAWLRVVLLGLGVASVLLVVGLWAGCRAHPHLVGPAGVRLRLGGRVGLDVGWDAVDVLRREAGQQQSVCVAEGRLHLPVQGGTALVLYLTRPVVARLTIGDTAEITSVAFTADDPGAVHRAVRENSPHAGNGRPTP